MKMHNYPSDITRKQFEIIRSDLENAKKKTRPRKYDLYDIAFTVLINSYSAITAFSYLNPRSNNKSAAKYPEKSFLKCAFPISLLLYIIINVFCSAENFSCTSHKFLGNFFIVNKFFRFILFALKEFQQRIGFVALQNFQERQ